MRRDGVSHATQQYATVDSAVLLIRIGKMPPDVSKPGGTEDRVTDGMNEHIAVRMCLQAKVVIDTDAAYDDVSAFTEAMGIKAVTNTHG